jgi:hypothetical protein
MYGRGVTTLLEIISQLAHIPPGHKHTPGSTIYCRRPWTPESQAEVRSGDSVPDGLTTESGLDYLLETDLAQDVVEVWSLWRNGILPTAEQATLAVIHYGENDAYQPVD